MVWGAWASGWLEQQPLLTREEAHESAAGGVAAADAARLHADGERGGSLVGSKPVVYLLHLGRALLVLGESSFRVRLGLSGAADLRPPVRESRGARALGTPARGVASPRPARLPRSGLGLPQERAGPESS